MKGKKAKAWEGQKMKTKGKKERLLPRSTI